MQKKIITCSFRGSNAGPTDFQSGALPTELKKLCNILHQFSVKNCLYGEVCTQLATAAKTYWSGEERYAYFSECHGIKLAKEEY